MSRKKLPIGIQTFAKIRENNRYYFVDKTKIALELIDEGSYYFLSRPRRFGKSLFLDTLRNLFEGNESLFKGLFAEKAWDWSQKHPVIRISFSDGVPKSRHDLALSIHKQLHDHESRWDLPSRFEDHNSRLADLIERIHTKTGQKAVVLVDEYDKPILDNIENSSIALEMREGLKNIYSVLKGADEHLRFVFLTGVSKFSKVSLFSGLNNLQDITLDPRYSTICGYTDNDVDTVFAPELDGLDRAEIRNWYNGYNWLGAGVYNPFDVLLLFSTREFKAHWFETGSPTFLIKLLTHRKIFTPDLSRLVRPETLLSTFDVDNIPSEALMFQAGYLTIDSVWKIPGRMQVTLKYPNREVQASMNELLLGSLTGNHAQSSLHSFALYDLLLTNNLQGLQKLFHAFFASIPNDWYRNNPIAQYEGYWASIFYSHFAALGLDILLEDVTNHGRIDMTVLFNKHIYIFEFKVVEIVPDGKALAQIQSRGYADKYRARGEPIHLIGVEFSKDNRNVVGFDIENIPQ